MSTTEHESGSGTGAAGAPAVEVQGLRLDRGGFRLEVDLVVPRGYVSGVVGPNGAGKSTTIRAMLGLLPVQAGRVRVLGQDVGPDAAVVSRVGVVLDRPLMAPEWRAGAAGSRVGRFSDRWDQGLFTDLMGRFDVPAGVRVGDLSRGQQVKLSTALALAHRPDLLVLDEPTSGLDPGARAELKDVLREYMAAGERTVLFSTHISSDLEDLADHVHLVTAGRVVHSGSLEAMGEDFAMARGPGRPGPAAEGVLIGVRRAPHGFEALVRTSDSAALGPEVLLEPATIDEVVTHLSGARALEEVAR